MIDFTKVFSQVQTAKKIDPIEIYDSLDRRSDIGPLRQVQENILKRWYSERTNKKDTIVKLHMGEGKTLVGLLILNSKLNSTNLPCMYVCPNKFLLDQTCQEAKRFGIPFCTFEAGELPTEFINGEKILIVHVQKVFNGLSKFNISRNSIDIGAIVLDDSHTCIESIQSSFTITVEKNHPLYIKLLSLFEEDLKEQGDGTFLDIKNGEYDSMLSIPYWAWIDKKDSVVEIISSLRNDDSIKFQWPLLKDDFTRCHAVISGNKLEIAPYILPMSKYPFWTNAENRILMSASTQDDAFLIKDLDFEIEAVKNPLTDNSKKWSGEKLVLIPSLFNEALDHDYIVNQIAPPKQKKFGVVIIVPSKKKSEQYGYLKSIVTTKENIKEHIDNLKKGNYESPIVLINRYDGIDLPDDVCRVLLLDSLPHSNTLFAQYEESVRSNSNIINKKIAQRIEQGMGRSVRGERDYSIIILIGSDLVQFIRSKKNTSLLSNQTEKQINIGIDLAKIIKDQLPENADYYKEFLSLATKLLKRDEGWKNYYKDQMNTIQETPKDYSLLEIFNFEKKAEQALYLNDFASAFDYAQKIADYFNNNQAEKAWYIQNMARIKYGFSKNDSNTLQISAYKQNHNLLKPKEGVNYEKIGLIDINRIAKIKAWIQQFENEEELRNNVNKILSDANFDQKSETFEEAIKNIGLMLGFTSQRPDKEYKKGPDNLWAIARNRYVFFECKNEVKEDRNEISKYECGQMQNHISWFKQNYPTSVSVKRVWLHPSKNLNESCNLNDEVVVMRKGKLKNFKENIKGFYQEIFKHPIGDYPTDTINNYLNLHKLDLNSIETLYTESLYQLSK